MSHEHDHKETPVVPVPVLKYLKDPVEVINDLYTKYPEAEYGWFAFIFSLGTFAWWNHRLSIPKWQPLSNYLFEDVDPNTLKDGDAYVWDPTKKKFTITNSFAWDTEEF